MRVGCEVLHAPVRFDEICPAWSKPFRKTGYHGTGLVVGGSGFTSPMKSSGLRSTSSATTISRPVPSIATPAVRVTGLYALISSPDAIPQVWR